MTTQCSDCMIQQHSCAPLLFRAISQSSRFPIWNGMQLSNRSRIFHPSIPLVRLCCQIQQLQQRQVSEQDLSVFSHQNDNFQQEYRLLNGTVLFLLEQLGSKNDTTPPQDTLQLLGQTRKPSREII